MAHATGDRPNLTQALVATFAGSSPEDPQRALALEVLKIVKNYLASPQQLEISTFIQSITGSYLERRFAALDSPSMTTDPVGTTATAFVFTQPRSAKTYPEQIACAEGLALKFLDQGAYAHMLRFLEARLPALNTEDAKRDGPGPCLFDLEFYDSSGDFYILIKDLGGVAKGAGIEQCLAILIENNYLPSAATELKLGAK